MALEFDVEGVPVLPTLQSELTLLDGPTRKTCLVHSLVVDHLLIHSGHAVWVDGGNAVATQPLLDLVPSQRFLERVTLARGFTPWQHQSLVREALLEQLDEQTRLVVITDIDRLYREEVDEQMGGRMLAAVLDVLETIAHEREIPVLVTRSTNDNLTERVEKSADRVLSMMSTDHGPRFVDDSTNQFETLVYREGQWVQTTISFWVRVLNERQRVREEIRQEVLAHGAH
ncbi:hypothetical protein [Halomarina rubra]|uniref:DNA recombination and repair protein Rad51-like C-terminal domain-containing protein n=1 Tax=Halomarina rubra TaxID=2071873 RepID=A0ABD6B0M6_9EURY|nr:hypothetical protein [Halomarina rubra]